MTRRVVGWGFLALFLVTIPLANWTVTRFGLVDTPWLGPVPAGVVWIGPAFVFRDVAQLALGRAWTWAAIVAGIAISYGVSAEAVATASAVAFAWSETTDALVYTRLAARGTARMFLLGVSISGYAASVVDSVLFVRIAFGGYTGWWQLTVAKIVCVMAATPIAYAARQIVTRRAVPLDVAA